MSWRTRSAAKRQEFFLPRDFDAPCLGCYTCFRTDLTHCPHYGRLKPLADAILAADLLIFASPVYVYHATGQMMSFLDHFGTWWVVHRPRPEMAHKQAVVIATAAGGGLKSTAKDIADSLEMWGVRKVYRLTFGVQASRPAEVPPRIQERIHAQTGRMSRRIQSGAGKTGYNRPRQAVVSSHPLCPPALRSFRTRLFLVGEGRLARQAPPMDGQITPGKNTNPPSEHISRCSAGISAFY